MVRTVMPRSALVVSALSLALVTGCSSSDSDGADSAKASAPASASATATAAGDTAAGDTATGAAATEPAGKVMTSAELDKAILVTADVEGHTVEEMAEADLPKAEDVTSVKAEACTPIAQAMTGVVIGKPSSTAIRDVRAKAASPAPGEDPLLAAFNITAVAVLLTAYDGTGSQDALASLKTAADACASGFTFTSDGDPEKVTKVTATTAPSGADEAVALTVEIEADGVKAPVKVVVARKGNTLAYFSALNPASLSTGADFEFPAQLVTAQLPKLV
jgi:hypothetical protein